MIGFFAIALLVPEALALAYDNLQGAQYIMYSGGVSGVADWFLGSNSSRCAYKGGPYNKTHLFVGVNAPWDTNPFYFGLWHRGSNCGTEQICYTRDTIINLQFGSASYGCWSYDGGDPCRDPASTREYSPEVYLDLQSGAKVQRRDVKGETGYQVEGSTWVGTDNMNWVDVESTCGFYTWAAWRWNDLSRVNFTLSFSNQTASLTILTDMLGYTDRNLVSTLNLTFEGSRDDLPIRPTSLGFHDLNPIQLKADSPSVPNFNYLNGSDIYFANITGDWYVAATPITVPPCTTFGQGLCTSPTETLSISKSTAGVGRGSTGNFVEMLVVVTVAVSILGA